MSHSRFPHWFYRRRVMRFVLESLRTDPDCWEANGSVVQNKHHGISVGTGLFPRIIVHGIALHPGLWWRGRIRRAACRALWFQATSRLFPPCN